ncbi:MAG: DUF4858 domain-containing protein [Bacteroides sp.]
MWKRIPLVVSLSLVVLSVSAQWTTKDSLNLKRMLNGEEELKLNIHTIKLIDLGAVSGKPRLSTEKNWMLPDESLPAVLPDVKKVILTLHPYTASTRFDWDPVYQKKIKVSKDTWRGGETVALKVQFNYANWAATPMSGEGGYRRSREEIEASGIRTRLMDERENNKLVDRVVMIPRSSGLNLMRIFEKSFWDKKGNDRRARTLEVLRTYGDSTTIQLPEPIFR